MGEKLPVDIEDNTNDSRAVAVQKCGIVDTAWFTSVHLLAVLLGRLLGAHSLASSNVTKTRDGRHSQH